MKLEPFLDQFKHAVDELERECALIAENAKADADECAREAFKMLSDLEEEKQGDGKEKHWDETRYLFD